MNPESLDSTIQSALSTLYPPFEATAPTVLSQLFRVIEERYRGDALQCLLDFLIPAKHILESVQQAACAAYSDVLFRCEGWPLCLRERVVIQLASLNPLLLRPGDFYLQVAPFADQAARIVLKSLLEEHREVEETPVPETSYPCIFTEGWLSDVNRERHGAPLRRCLLSTDQGVVKVPWSQVANPEFVHKPRAMATSSASAPSPASPVLPEPSPEPPLPPPRAGPSPFSLETRIQPARDGIAVSLRLVEGGHSGSVRAGGAVPAGKPVGWVSPSTWDGRHVRDLEGDYVDLVDFTKEKEARPGAPSPTDLSRLKPTRPPPPAPPGPHGDPTPCGRTLGLSEEPCTPCLRRRLGQAVDPQELKCRFRDSYVAALQNPVSFEARSMLVIPEESPPVARDGSGSETDSKAPRQAHGGYCCHSGPPCQNSTAREGSASPPGHLDVQNFKKAHKNVGKPLSPSPSTVSETSRKCPATQRQSKRSNSDICAEMIPRVHVVQCKKTTAFGLVSPKLDRRKSSKKDVALLCKAGGLAPLSPVDGQEKGLQAPPAEKQLGPKIHPCSPQDCGPSPAPPPPPNSALLRLGVVCLPGSRDRTGRAVMEVYGDHQGWRSPLVSKQELSNLLHHLHSIPRKEVTNLGMTVVIDARKKSPPETLLKALLMVQLQASDMVSCVLMLVDKETGPRPERHPGLQMEVVTSMKALHKTVEGPQLTSRLDGTFAYDHSDWLKLYQKLGPFVSDLQEASSLLQRAIAKLGDKRRVDTVQEVQQCTRERKALMREVLEDARLVALQREGGATLARLRKEEARFRHSEDYRDAMDSVTSLYNQVEEQVHALVMKSNESQQHLEFLIQLRDLEDRFKRVRGWFAEEGEWQLVEANAALDTLERVEQTRLRFSSFLAQTSEQNQQAVALMAEAEKMDGVSYPEMGAFRAMVRTFKTSLADFSQRAERCRAELETMARLYRFCEKATELAKDCRQYLEQAQPGCCSRTHLSALTHFQERFAEFSAERFGDAKARASGCSRGMRVWNVAWPKCQEARQLLEERLQALDGTRCQAEEDESLSPPPVRAAASRPRDARREPGRGGANQPEKGGASGGGGQAEGRGRRASEGNTASVTCFNINLRPHANGARTATDSGPELPSPGDKEERESTEERDGDAGFGEGDPADGPERVPCHQALSRSLSEGSGVGCPPAGPRESPRPLAHGQPSCRILRAAQLYQISRHGSFCAGEPRPLGDPETAVALETAATATPATPGREGVTPVGVAHTEENGSSFLKLQRVAGELLATERDYVRSLGYVAAHYVPELGRPDVPQGLRGQRGCIFGNLEKLHDFHRLSFLPELEDCARDPPRIGRCFLRHKEGFALYALYSKNKPQSDALLSQHGNTFFKQKQAELGDKMDLWSYLLKPIQRISKYSLLLQDMARECGPERARERAEIQAALEVIRFQLRHGNDLLAMDDIQDCDVNLKEQGQLIRQDEFLVSFRKKKCFRHIFLFQDLILFSKTKKTEVGNDLYIYKQSFKTSDIGMTHTSGSSGLCFEIWFRRRKSQDTYTLQAESEVLKKSWTSDLERILWDQAVLNREIRMQERVFMGIGNKPFIDIKPSEAAISDRAVNCVLTGGESKVSTSSGGALILPRPNSIGSGSSASSSESRSSFSSGRGSLSAIGHLCDQSQTGNSHGVYYTTTALEDDDLDNESESFHLLLDSSESSGESVSGFSSSDQICLSLIGGEAEDASSVSSSRASGKRYPHQIPQNVRRRASPGFTSKLSFASPTQRAQTDPKGSGKANEIGPNGKSTEV